MATSNILDRFLDPVTECLTPEVAQKIAEIRVDPDLDERVRELGQKANDGTISPEEDAEYKRYIEVGGFLNVLKAKARFVLSRHAAS